MKKRYSSNAERQAAYRLRRQEKEDLSWQLPKPRKFEALADSDNLPDISYTFLSLLSYRSAEKAYESEMRRCQDPERRSMIAVLWLKLRTQLYKQTG